MAKSQAFFTQDPRKNSIKKPSLSLVLKPPNSLPISKISNKKAKREKNIYQWQVQAWQDSGSLATNVNATNISDRARNDRDQEDASKAIYYNYNKKEHFVRNCSKPRKNCSISKNKYQSCQHLLQ